MLCQGWLTHLVLHNLAQILNAEATANALKEKNIPDIRTGDILAMRVVRISSNNCRCGRWQDRMHATWSVSGQQASFYVSRQY